MGSDRIEQKVPSEWVAGLQKLQREHLFVANIHDTILHSATPAFNEQNFKLLIYKETNRISVLSFLTNTASNAVLSPTEQSSIAISIATLQSRMALHFDRGAIKQHFRFGSSTRGTILPRSMDNQSDIDYMGSSQKTDRKVR